MSNPSVGKATKTFVNEEICIFSTPYMPTWIAARQALLPLTQNFRSNTLMTLAYILKKFPLVISGATIISLGTLGTAQAAIIFDGGAPNLASGNEVTGWVQAEDFILGATQQVTAANFWTIEQPGQWDGTLSYFLFADNRGAPASAFFASGQGANVTKQATGNSALGLTEYAYSFDLANPVNLLASTRYWFGLHLSTDFNRDGIYWETTGSGFDLSGQESSGGTFDNWFGNSAQHAFYLTGNAEAIPTPALLPGLIGMGVTAIRKRKAAAAESANKV
jgi:hypothetical protein